MLYILENRHNTGGVSEDEEKRKSCIKEAIKLHEAKERHKAENKFKSLKSDKT